MKKLFALVMAVLMVMMCFAACGGGNTDTTPPNGGSAGGNNATTPNNDPTGGNTEKPTIVVGYTNYEPMNYEDENGELVGFDTDLAKAVFGNLGYEVMFQLIDWSARYTESREDTLRFDLGLSKDDYDKYLELCEQSGLVYCADLQINALFESGTIPKEFYSDKEPDEESTLQESIEKAYARAELLNER